MINRRVLFLLASTSDPDEFFGDDLKKVAVDKTKAAIKAFAHHIATQPNRYLLVTTYEPIITHMIADEFIKASPITGIENFLNSVELLHNDFFDPINVNKYKTSIEEYQKALMEMHEEIHATVIIGGGKKQMEDYSVIKTTHPDSAILPLISTGGAAKHIFNNASVDRSLTNPKYSGKTEDYWLSLKSKSDFKKMFKYIL